MGGPSGDKPLRLPPSPSGRVESRRGREQGWTCSLESPVPHPVPWHGRAALRRGHGRHEADGDGIGRRCLPVPDKRAPCCSLEGENAPVGGACGALAAAVGADHITPLPAPV